MGRGFESLRSHSHFLLKNPASFSRTRGFFVVNYSTCTRCLNRAFYPPSTGESLSLISIVDWIPRETRSSAFAIVLGVRSRSSRVRSWIWVEAPRRSTERDLANFATYIPCRVDGFQARRAGTSSAGSKAPVEKGGQAVGWSGREM